MQSVDFFRNRIDAAINLIDPLGVLTKKLSWSEIEAAVAQKFEHQVRSGQVLKFQDMFEQRTVFHLQPNTAYPHNAKAASTRICL